MKIGTCVYIDDDNPLESKFAALRKNGFDNCQIISWKQEKQTDDMAAQINGLAEKYGVTVSAFWCGYEGECKWNFYEGPKTIGLVPPQLREKRVGNLCHGSDFAVKLNVKNVVTHMGFIPEDPNDPLFSGLCDAVKRVALHCKQNGQNLLFETGQETPTAMLRCFETVGEDNLGVNLDTANLILYGKANPADALDVFGKYVKNLHAKDGMYPTDGHSLGKEVPVGDGKVDFVQVFKKLRDYGYDGFVTIEREIGGEQQMADILNAKKYLSKIISEIYGEE